MAVAPTLKSRIQSLDVLRGIAILGILLANIFAFGWTEASEMLGGKSHIPGMNYWVEGVRVAFVTGKFRGLFCLLFGAGLFLQYGKLKAAGQWPLTYLKRTAILMFIGGIHLVLIWFGDILFMYSLTAFIVMWLIGLEDRAILGIGSGMLVLTTLCGLGAVAGSAFTSGIADVGSSQISAREMLIFQSGSLLEQIQFRLPVAGKTLIFFPFLFLELGGLFLIGLWMARKGIFAKPSAHPTITNWLLAIGGIGALLNLAIGFGIGITHNKELTIPIEFGLNSPMAIGYATLGAVLVEKYPNSALSRLFAPVGKMALTGYLLTSVLCTTFFYSWGLGMFGRLDYFGLLGVVVVVWIIVIGFAHFWLKRFLMGPVEWVWRALTLGRFSNRISAQSELENSGSNVPPVL
jgi:uncharacterized protein